MKPGLQDMRSNIKAGATQGAMVWMVYGIVESVFSTIVPWLTRPSHTYSPLHPGFTALLFAVYLMIGLTVGGLCGGALWTAGSRIPVSPKEQSTTIFYTAVTVTIVVTFAVNLVIQSGFAAFELPPLFMSLLFLCALVLGTVSARWSGKLSFITNPWTVCVTLVGLPWTTQDLLFGKSWTVKAMGAFGYAFAIFLIAFLAQMAMKLPRLRASLMATHLSPMRVLKLLAFAALIVCGMNLFFLDRVPLQNVPELWPSLGGSKRPNIVLITTDTVGAAHMSLYDYKRDTTPNLKKLAKEATLYTWAIAPSDVTLSTHASLFTSTYATQHGAHFAPESHPLPDSFVTLAEVLSKHGYVTMAVVANYSYLRASFNMNQGFQYYDVRVPVLFLGHTQPYYLREGIRDIFTWFASPPNFDARYEPAKEINKVVFDLLGKAKLSRVPFFLFINYMDAHDPYYPPPPFDTRYPGKDKTFTFRRYHQLRKKVSGLERQLTQEEARHLISQYDGGIAYLDVHLGKLIARLKELDLYENAMLIITSDHGESFGRRDLLGHGVSVYQEQIHVPLIIKYPNSSKKQVMSEVVSIIDIMPTILDVLGFDIPDGVQGKTLRVLNGRRSVPVISESFPNGYLVKWHPRFHRIERAIFSGEWKMITSSAGKKELYDIVNDPEEERNLYSENGASRGMQEELRVWLESIQPATGTALKLDKVTLDSLKSLGYVR